MATTYDGDDDHCGLIGRAGGGQRRWHPAVAFKEQAAPYRQPINIMLGFVIAIKSDRAPAEYDPTATV